MTWLEKVRNKITFIVKRETPDNLWHRCPGCKTMIFNKEYEENLSVCPKCGYHGRIGSRARFDFLFDEGDYSVLPPPVVAEDPLKFRDTKRYADRLKAARTKSGENDALLNAQGLFGGRQTIIGVQDFSFMGGSMGLAVGSAFVAGIRAAIRHQSPYIIFTAAGGARMQEGILSLMQMPRTTAAIAELKEAGLPYIVVLTDPTTGGVTASYAMLGDIQIAEPGALIGFAGQRVIESTIREKLPDGFQRAEYLLEHGMIDMVVPRSELRNRLISLMDYLLPVSEPA
ncbi:MAG: acetyl-CoA carboxylase, carboxyltransferase subunit beta [Zymomonas mobilis subsp. pomaceae]|uniref:Acetyl-coenzyme A carboxylase carboxyl transferase subunit beta n=1 Tax=Zymomonas mobilis subsp. pomaceae (strain ATCC 29192 / DSM 22645 / JCM 10191 / CCUG 17912 / NBRC 13757 / NCIMB 11200 / NRRL B-4491 / Barker I) TaxID=579138 RepID=F8ERT0_ZYMMT|nr:acetyl-CoA carboxylase, carboxyltransferase subunit beta [Zymomonas mobilis]AEI37538.1 acetyl-CoA carboxylase, carboxyl transferase, beta subunit [Zymomonas mobilis subsp. pomaceae ATCC 29192]MDX5948906.1 acetyl-CoA carboxylase, carboxyltransferase subunit beta [Zymomonas mobilis subsp. pomaceae]GEB88712.1 acetyl-coenzyme A carboxylase carboxyl transferase subunit beta [Zymomonas mobilis subsp. pomaceae]